MMLLERSSSRAFAAAIVGAVVVYILLLYQLSDRTTVVNNFSVNVVSKRLQKNNNNTKPNSIRRSPPKRPFNYTKFHADVRDKNITVDRIPRAFPKPKLAESSQVYNPRAWRELADLIASGRNFSLCLNGGSATAGGGLQTVQQRYGNVLVDYMKDADMTRPETTVDLIQRGHGTRHSLHSALLLDWYIPSHTDVVLWEFAINDVGYHLDEFAGPREERNELIFWLDRIARVEPRPPKVILVYLWKTPFRLSDDGAVNPVFDHHSKLAAHYDFVVGHVNLGAYMREMKMNFDLARKAFLADAHHPNPMGNAVLAFMILDLLKDEKRLPKDPLSTTAAKYAFEWACGNETAEKRLIQQRVQPRAHRSPRPVAAFTNEHPKNFEIRPGMIYPTAETDTVLVGKASQQRDDRLLSVPLPCCRGGSTDNGNATKLATTIDFVGQQPIREEIQAFLLGIMEYSGPLQVYLDDRPAKGTMIPAYRWPCLWNFRDVYKNNHWFALDVPWNAAGNISSIGLCSLDNCCRRDPSAARGCTNLLSLVVF